MEEGGKIRLFTALEIPPDLKKQIASLPKTKLDFKTISHPNDLHITLRFLGDVDAGLLPEIEEALEGMKKPSSFGMEVSGLGVFTKKDKAVLHAVVQSTRKISFLADAITLKMNQLGLKFEARPYIPHITIAKLVTARNAESYKKEFARAIHAQWTASAFHLMRSASSGEGERRYTVLKSFALSPY